MQPDKLRFVSSAPCLGVFAPVFTKPCKPYPRWPKDPGTRRRPQLDYLAGASETKSNPSASSQFQAGVLRPQQKRSASLGIDGSNGVPGVRASPAAARREGRRRPDHPRGAARGAEGCPPSGRERPGHPPRGTRDRLHALRGAETQTFELPRNCHRRCSPRRFCCRHPAEALPGRARPCDAQRAADARRQARSRAGPPARARLPKALGGKRSPESEAAARRRSALGNAAASLGTCACLSSAQPIIRCARRGLPPQNIELRGTWNRGGGSSVRGRRGRHAAAGAAGRGAPDATAVCGFGRRRGPEAAPRRQA